MIRPRVPAGQLELPLARPSAEIEVAIVSPSVPPSVPTSEASPAAGVVVVRRRGTRRYVLRVLDDGTVRVTVPWWGSRRGALAFVATQHDWIDRQRARQRVRASVPWHAGRQVLIDGDPHSLEIGDDGGVWLAGSRVAATVVDGEALRRSVGTCLRQRARRELPVALLALAAQHGLSVGRVTIRDQASRWGSCSGDGAISLNWRLVQMPPWVREYVLVHELMHLRQLNHSPRFWRLVAAACPRYLEARRWLRRDGHALFG